jgi:hypothetical protein
VRTWLTEKVDKQKEINSTEKEDYGIPLRTDGERYLPEALAEDQKDVFYYVMSKVYHWIDENLGAEQGEGDRTFVPLRITVAGEAGSGKSVLVKTITSAIREIFKTEDSVIICGPTGSAAFNAGGSTAHSTCSMPFDCNPEISAGRMKKLLAKFGLTVALILDERSMFASSTSGMLEYRVAQAALGGALSEESFGGIPIVIVIGDDYQLMPILPGAFYILDKSSAHKKKGYRTADTKYMTERGDAILLELAQKTMHLRSIKRQDPQQQQLLRFLKGVRGAGDAGLTREEADELSNYCLSKHHFTFKDREDIENKSMFLFARNEDKDAHNIRKLKQLNNAERPVAVIKAETTKSGQLFKSTHFNQKDSIPASTRLCRGSKVAIANYNIYPGWGLFNGGIGTVVDIVYEEGKNPNTGDLPEYVLVRFPQYIGPPLVASDPKLVPIPVEESRCQHGCCVRKFIPLTLAFGKTIHSFQGGSAGPVRPGQPPNSVECIVCDLGKKDFEMMCPGLTYTLMSRPTTLGDRNDRYKSSALYFQNLIPDRLMNLTTTQAGTVSERVRRRQEWVRYLEDHTISPSFSEVEIGSLMAFVKETRLDRNDLQCLVRNYTKRHRPQNK